MLVAKLDGLRLVPRTHMVEGELTLESCSLTFLMSAVAHTIDEHRHVSHMLQFCVVLCSCPLRLLRPSDCCYITVCLRVETIHVSVVGRASLVKFTWALATRLTCPISCDAADFLRVGMVVGPSLGRVEIAMAGVSKHFCS